MAQARPLSASIGVGRVGLNARGAADTAYRSLERACGSASSAAADLLLALLRISALGLLALQVALAAVTLVTGMRPASDDQPSASQHRSAPATYPVAAPGRGDDPAGASLRFSTVTVDLPRAEAGDPAAADLWQLRHDLLDQLSRRPPRD